MGYHWADAYSRDGGAAYGAAACSHRLQPTDTPVSLETLIHAITVPFCPDYHRQAVFSPQSASEVTLGQVSRMLDGIGYLVIKPMLESLLVLLTAPLWLPLCIIIAFAIWLEDGACPLYMQKRIGKAGKSFTILKFRTMVPNAGEVLHTTLLCSAGMRHDWHATYKLKTDPRITRVGKFLRRYSLDELPQLLNVLAAQMSLIGPRPLPAYHHEQLSRTARDYRGQVRPGLTGLWQVSGRSDIGNRGMELWDPFYVRNWSLWLDFDILARTVRAVINGNGAY